MRRLLVLAALLASAAAQGGAHWAFVAPTRPPVPAVQRADWPQNPIDCFVLAGLERRGLQPQPRADRAALLRRLCLELTGLPPTLAELDAFAADAAADATARRIDALLATARHAEHLTRWWLDAARYGDTHGMEADFARTLWPWRDWVIAAFAANMPFDQFTREQLAGDLVPSPTPAQRVATGFHRNGMTTAEGGLVPEEMLARYASERVEVTGTVWLGLTLGCARCHDHKYDPITQRDFYALSDFFHSNAEQGSNENAAAPPPRLPVPDEGQQQQLDDYQQKLDELRAARDELDPDTAAAAAAWTSERARELQQRWQPPVVAAASAHSGAVLTPQPDGSIEVSGADAEQDVYDLELLLPPGPFAALRVEALPTADGRGPGRADNGNAVLTGITAAVATGDAAGNGGPAFVPVPLRAAHADFSQRGFPPAHALDGDADTGWALGGGRSAHALVCTVDAAGPAAGSAAPRRLRLQLGFQSKHVRHTLARFRIAVSSVPPLPATVELSPWEQCGPLAGSGPELLTNVAVPPRPAEAAFTPRPEFTDDAVHELPATVGATFLRRTLLADRDCEVILGLGSDDGLGAWLDGELLHSVDVQRAAGADQELVTARLTAGAHELLLAIVNTGGPAGFFCRLAGVAPDDVAVGIAADLLAPAPDAAQRARVLDYWRRHHDASFRGRSRAIAGIERLLAAIQAQVAATMVMQELAERRPSHVLQRGRYDLPGERVAAAVPAFLPALPATGRADRLALARWLCSRDQPLTARVTVNRLWQFVFGRGLVATPHDFGRKGSPPSHPELLDWLACEFMDSGWDLRHMLVLMVSSATWQQRAATDAAAYAGDPDNVWLGRGGRHRLDAEVIRDQALALAGLLVERQGGPSVRPYQPPGVWEAVAFPTSNTQFYAQDHGDALYRRSLYTFWKRTAPPALLALLDAPSRETCAVFRERTNTPLQALALLNDTTFAEAARCLAARVLQQPGDDRARLQSAFRTCTARAADDRELATLQALLDDSRARFAGEPDAAKRLIAIGETPAATDLDPLQQAAFTVVVNLLLNLDAVLTRS